MSDPFDELVERSLSQKALALDTVLHYAKRAKAAQIASEKACDVRAAMTPGTSRARVTSANAKWSRLAEDRDRALASLREAYANAVKLGAL